MKQIINGKTYNTATMTTLASVDRYNNGNWCGDDSIRVTSRGAYAYVRASNGQDLYREESIEAINQGEIAGRIEGWKLNDEEVALLQQHGVGEEA